MLTVEDIETAVDAVVRYLDRWGERTIPNWGRSGMKALEPTPSGKPFVVHEQWIEGRPYPERVKLWFGEDNATFHLLLPG